MCEVAIAAVRSSANRPRPPGASGRRFRQGPIGNSAAPTCWPWKRHRSDVCGPTTGTGTLSPAPKWISVTPGARSPYLLPIQRDHGVKGNCRVSITTLTASAPCPVVPRGDADGPNRAQDGWPCAHSHVADSHVPHETLKTIPISHAICLSQHGIWRQH